MCPQPQRATSQLTSAWPHCPARHLASLGSPSSAVRLDISQTLRGPPFSPGAGLSGRPPSRATPAALTLFGHPRTRPWLAPVWAFGREGWKFRGGGASTSSSGTGLRARTGSPQGTPRSRRQSAHCLRAPRGHSASSTAGGGQAEAEQDSHGHNPHTGQGRWEGGSGERAAGRGAGGGPGRGRAGTPGAAGERGAARGEGVGGDPGRGGWEDQGWVGTPALRRGCSGPGGDSGSVGAQGWSGGSKALAAAELRSRVALPRGPPSPKRQWRPGRGRRGFENRLPTGERRRRRSRAWTEGLRGCRQSRSHLPWHFPKWSFGRCPTDLGPAPREGRPREGGLEGL